MYATPIEQANVYFKLQYKAKTNGNEVDEDISGEAATDVRVQTLSHENTNQETNNGKEASPQVDNVHLELQYRTNTNGDEVYEDIGGEAATDVRVQTPNHENTNQEANNRREASPEVDNTVQRDVVRRMPLFLVVAVVIIFLIAAAALSLVIILTLSKNTPTVPKYSATVEDINKCTTNAHNCDVNALCTNDVPSYHCTCNPGYTGNGTSCTDINECTTNAHNCDVNALCTNDVPYFNCTCNPGYTGNGTSCAGCQDHWVRHGNACYYYINDKPTTKWKDARSKCQKMGADLPIIKSSAQNTFIVDLLKKQATRTKTGVWLGMERNDKTSKLDFYWIDKSPVKKQAYQNWAEGEPNMHLGVEYCGIMYVTSNKDGKQGEWNDFRCDCTNYYGGKANCPVVLCQMPLSSGKNSKSIK